MTAPTDTPRTDAKIGAFRVTYQKDGGVGEEQFTSAVEQWGEMAEFARTLERELSAARAAADELARRVALRFMLDYWPWELNDEAVRADAVKVTIVRVRAEMEKEKGNG